MGVVDVIKRDCNICFVSILLHCLSFSHYVLFSFHSPISTSTQLDDKSQHGLFGRHITSDDGTAIPAILFFRDVLKIDHLAIIQ